MDQNPDVHAKWVGLKVVHVEPADASPVLGVVKKSKEQNQQASFKLLLDDGSTVWLNAKNTAGAAVARQEFDEAQKALGFPRTEDVVADANKGAGASDRVMWCASCCNDPAMRRNNGMAQHRGHQLEHS